MPTIISHWRPTCAVPSLTPPGVRVRRSVALNNRPALPALWDRHRAKGNRTTSRSKGVAVGPSYARKRRIEMLAPKWGDEAAYYFWRVRTTQVLMVPLYARGLLALVLRSHSTIFWVLLSLFVAGTLALTAVIVVYQRRMERAASNALGVQLSWRRGKHPPQKSPAYEEWCEVNGLTPYSASTRLSR